MINVDQEIPEIETPVLCYAEGRFVVAQIYTTHDGELWWEECEQNLLVNNVTHWQQLPEEPNDQ